MNNQGLTTAQAAQRLTQTGENRLAGKKQTSVAAMFFSQFKDVMILILAAATVLSVMMGQGTEAIAVQFAAMFVTTFLIKNAFIQRDLSQSNK